MALVSCDEMLHQAVKGGYAVPQFNINSLEWCKTVLETCESLKSPVILGTAMKAAQFMAGYRTVHAMAEAMIKDLQITVPVSLHLDHGTFEACLDCIHAGYTSVMFDGSNLPFHINLSQTRELSKLCRKKGISLEAEAGTIGGGSEEAPGEYAVPEECMELAGAGITMLAAGIGNIHGNYPDNWTGLDWEVLQQIKHKTGSLPLVLHGGSGIPEEMLKKSISLGVSKININTECQTAFMEGAKNYFNQGHDLEPKGYFVRNMFSSALEYVKPVLIQKIHIFGSAGKG